MPDIFLSEVPVVEDFNNFCSFMGTKLISGTEGQPDAVYEDYRFTPQQIILYVLSMSRKDIEIQTAGDSFSDSWINGKVIKEIVTDTLTYKSGENFNQSGSTITGIGGVSFYQGQKVTLKL